MYYLLQQWREEYKERQKAGDSHLNTKAVDSYLNTHTWHMYNCASTLVNETTPLPLYFLITYVPHRFPQFTLASFIL